MIIQSDRRLLESKLYPEIEGTLQRVGHTTATAHLWIPELEGGEGE